MSSRILAAQGIKGLDPVQGGQLTREEIAAGLRPLLELPVEHVLATHGGPTDRAALERALSSS